MGMTNKEETLDWLYRLRSEIYVYMPKEWLIPMNNALDMAIKALEQEPTTKNDLGVDCISRQAVLDIVDSYSESQSNVEDVTQDIISDIMVLPSVNSQEPKPMVEIDLDYVIKQKYIEREVLNKIREQIKSNLRGVEIALEVLVENHPLRPKMEGAKDTLEECLEIIDKYKAETEEV